MEAFCIKLSFFFSFRVDLVPIPLRWFLAKIREDFAFFEGQATVGAGGSSACQITGWK